MPSINATQKDPATVALIGCGSVSSLMYGPTLRRAMGSGLARTIAVVDPSAERAAELRRQLPEAQAFATVSAMLAVEVPDLAIIAAPHSMHVSIAEECFSSGASVLCEKPMALTTAECDRMIAAADRARRVLAVGHFRRFFWSCRAIKQIVESGILGAIKSFAFLEGETYSWPAASASFFDRRQAGGGVLIDAGAHTLDLLLWWFGDVADVHYADDAMGGVESNCVLDVRMTSGVSGRVQLSRDFPLPNRYVIHGEKGWAAYVCDTVDRIEMSLNDSSIGFDAQLRTAESSVAGTRFSAPAPSFMDCFYDQLANTVAAARGANPVAVSGMDARRTVALIERCYDSKSLLAMPWLPENEQRRARELANV